MALPEVYVLGWNTVHVHILGLSAFLPLCVCPCFWGTLTCLTNEVDWAGAWGVEPCLCQTAHTYASPSCCAPFSQGRPLKPVNWIKCTCASPALSLKKPDPSFDAFVCLSTMDRAQRFAAATGCCCLSNVLLTAVNKALECACCLCSVLGDSCIELKTTGTEQYNCCHCSLRFVRSARNTDEQQLNETVINDSAPLPFVFDTAGAGGQSYVSGEKHMGGKGMTEEC